jgi:hypothetical protein
MPSTISAGTTTGTAIVVAGDTTGNLAFQTNGTTTAVTINTSQGVQFLNSISVGNATPTTSGAGITFPASQSASTDANTLDDYEEGTWTPNQGAGLTVIGAFSSAGTYVKIGRVVTITGKVTGATSVAVAQASIISSNLPFTGSTDSLGSASNNALTVAGGTYGTTNASLYSTIAISATTNIFFSLTYYTST